MEDLHTTAEELIYDVEETERLLNVFLDFYENEGCAGPNASDEDVKLTALFFMDRTEQYISTVRAAVALVKEARTKAEELNKGILKENCENEKNIDDKMVSKVRQNKVISGVSE